MLLLRNKDQQKNNLLASFATCLCRQMSELQAYHCMTPEQRTWLKCSVSVIPGNKLSLQELSQLIGIELLTSSFL